VVSCLWMHYWSLSVFLNHWHTWIRTHEPAGCVAICYTMFSSRLQILEKLWPRLRDHTNLTPFSQNRLVPCVPKSSCRRRRIPQGLTQARRVVAGACPEYPFECTSTSGQQWVLFGYGLEFVHQAHVLACAVCGSADTQYRTALMLVWSQWCSTNSDVSVHRDYRAPAVASCPPISCQHDPLLDSPYFDAQKCAGCTGA